MANPVWPAQVPTKLVGGLEDAPEANLAEFAPDAGPPVRRMKTSVITSLIQFQTRMTATEWTLLKAFYRTTTKNGVLPFDRPHPLKKNATGTFTFVAPPIGRAVGRSLYRVALSLREMP